MASPRKLTKKGIDNLDIPNDAPTFIRDSTLRGFGIKITLKGKRVFFSEVRIKGANTKRVTIGSYPAIKLEEAREIARKNLLTMSQGEDPVVVVKEQRKKREREDAVEEALSKTLQFVFDQYKLARHHKLVYGTAQIWMSSKPCSTVEGVEQLGQVRFAQLPRSEMPDNSVSRKFAAILSTDVVGFS